MTVSTAMQGYTVFRNGDGTVVIAPTRQGIYGRDGYMLYSEAQVTRATLEQLREMRRELREYNNNK
ncbi:hypothetical protein FACS1894188_07740 [Clostridia bacterium]|nr:hypothetical protein FACS1894188_07740 [Clostridia bacterium]